ncbi:MAG: response regulator [Candidatus Omnitrophica bacterium]|nr:response regulator [Candidatus Omnitrophota bacterium]
MNEIKKKILVVDDEPDILNMIRLRLEANGYEVITASDGNTAYQRARSDSPDLIILDLMLPGMDGYQVCRLLKFDERYRSIPVIILTALSQKEDKEWAEKVGADCYLTKPFESDELLNKIKEFFRRQDV